jgi:hypothetical protein
VILVGADSLVLFGPGSEWLWSLISDVVLVVTLVGIFVQLRSDRATRVFNQVITIRTEWASKPERHARLVALIDLEDSPVEDGLPQSAYSVLNWFDRIGHLVQNGHLNVKDVGAVFADDVLFWWSVCEPYVKRDRERIGIAQILMGLEYLAGRMARLWKEDTGESYVLRQTIADHIEGYTALLKRQRDIEQGSIPTRRSEIDDGEQAATAD